MNVVLGGISLTVIINLLLIARQGFCHENRHHFRHRSPNNCLRCPPGWGVTAHCTATQNTTCAPCPSGHYSGHHSYKLPCWSCSRCGQGLYIAHACTSIVDTVCDSCRTFRGLHNADFRAKCVEGQHSKERIVIGNGRIVIHPLSNESSRMETSTSSALPLALTPARDLNENNTSVMSDLISTNDSRPTDAKDNQWVWSEYLSAKNPMLNSSKLHFEVFLIVIGSTVAVALVAVVIRMTRKRKFHNFRRYEGLWDVNEFGNR